MCHEYKFACFNRCCQLLPGFNGELYLVHWWKMFIISALSNMGAWHQVSGNPKTKLSRKRCVLVHCLAGRCNSQAIPTSMWKWLFWAYFVVAMVKLQQFVISETYEADHQSRVAIQQLSAVVETSKFLLTAQYEVSITSQLAKNI